MAHGELRVPPAAHPVRVGDMLDESTVLFVGGDFYVFDPDDEWTLALLSSDPLIGGTRDGAASASEPPSNDEIRWGF
ncbi:hypothetical protein M885DRAFT_575868 [Pelagophyceae sp. CCMP2097]|nr:hypothetical protein M885DRAFT_575868 [Pelagophyceae sp. CCMP2097]